MTPKADIYAFPSFPQDQREAAPAVSSERVNLPRHKGDGPNRGQKRDQYRPGLPGWGLPLPANPEIHPLVASVSGSPP